MKHIAEQFELPLNKAGKGRKTVVANVRMGKMPRFVTGLEIAALCMPKGDGAQEAFERDLSMAGDDDEFNPEY